MKKIIDLQTFQKITTDCMRVHETVRSTEPLTAEAERILQLADLLLREAGLAYLNEGQNLDVPSVPNSEQATPPEQVVESFIGVQHALVDLKQALYQLVKTHLDEQRWPELETSFNALIYLGEDGSDVPNVVKEIENTFIQLLRTHIAEQRWPELAALFDALSSFGENGSEFSSLVKVIDDTFISIEDTFLTRAGTLWWSSGEWDKGRIVLKPLLFTPRVRMAYYLSYIHQSYRNNDNRPLIELKSQLPAESYTGNLDDLAKRTDKQRHRWGTGRDLTLDAAMDEVKKIVEDPDFNPN